MFRIGDFSKLSQVSVKALRYYDEMGLLKPATVDRFTGYRYYSASQLPRLNRILALKDLGLSLEQIALLLEQELTPEQIRGMLRLKQAEIQQQVMEERERLARVEARLRQIEQEGKMPDYDILLKQVPPQRVACIRGTIPSYGEQHVLWNELEAYLAQSGIRPCGPCLTVYYDPEYRERDVDAEVCEPIDAPLAVHGRVQVRELPAVRVASTVHHGPFTTLVNAYRALLEWIEKNGYQIAGPNREVYLQTADATDQVKQDDPSYVTEIMLPVARS